MTLTNTTEQAFAGTRSLKTTGRTAGFKGPSRQLIGQLTKGATYGVTVSARLVDGEAATTVRVTMQRTLTGRLERVRYDRAERERDRRGVGDDDRGLHVHDRRDRSAPLRRVDVADRLVLHRQLQHHAGRAAARPARQHRRRHASFESGAPGGLVLAHGRGDRPNTTADAHSGTRSLLTTNRTATFRGPAFNVTNVMFNGSRYRVEVWVKLAPGEASTQLRVSLQRNLGTFTTSFHTLVGNTTVTNGAWVMLAATFDNALANTSLTLYVETASGNQSFYIDDFKITFIPPAGRGAGYPVGVSDHGPVFPVGSAVRGADLSGQSAVLLTKHFNSITSENDMKWDATEPTLGTFTFANADAQVAFAKANNMRVWGHTLVWHKQIPAAVFNDVNGVPMTPTPENRALLIQRMRNHIQGVVTHFGTDVGTWDVVNEAINQSQADGYRRSPWFNIIGPDFIDIAFQAAREFAPTAKLYYNDFSTTDTTKLAFIAALVSGMKSRGVPIDGVGHQMHNNVDFPSGAAVTTPRHDRRAGRRERRHRAGRQRLQRLVPGSGHRLHEHPAGPVRPAGLPLPDLLRGVQEGRAGGQAQVGDDWGKSDAQTWLTSSTRVDGPLLFDMSFKKKHAYWAVVDPLQLPGADLSTTMTAAPMTVPAGQAVAYTITVRNNADTTRSRSSRLTTICRRRTSRWRRRSRRTRCSSRWVRPRAGRAARRPQAAAGRCSARSRRFPRAPARSSRSQSGWRTARPPTARGSPRGRT